MKIKYTSTPWSAKGLSIKNNDHSIFVAETYSEDISHEEQLANAEFIVRVANVHDELVKIVKNTRDHLMRSGTYLFVGEAREYLKEVEDALRLAGEEL